MDSFDMHSNYPTNIPIALYLEDLLSAPKKDIELEVLRMDHPTLTRIPMAIDSALRTTFNNSAQIKAPGRALRISSRITEEDEQSQDLHCDIGDHLTNVRATEDATELAGNDAMVSHEMNLDEISQMLKSNRNKSMNAIPVVEDQVSTADEYESPIDLFLSGEAVQILQNHLDDQTYSIEQESNRSYSLIDDEEEITIAGEYRDNEEEELSRDNFSEDGPLEIPSSKQSMEMPEREKTRRPTSAPKVEIDMQALRCKDVNDDRNAATAGNNIFMKRPSLVSWFKGLYVAPNKESSSGAYVDSDSD